MTDLIKRLEEAEEGSRELDARLAGVFSHDVESDDGDFWWGPFDQQATRVPDFTTSLDAARDLADRTLPGWAWEIRMDQDVAFVQAAPKWWQEGLAAPDEDGVSAEGNTAALAICIAILKATDTGREG
jgi:hypothetical protein